MADSRPETFYQTVNFFFSVEFSTIPAESLDVRFQAVSGLDAAIDTENVKEGGENRFEHVLPTRRKYGPLVLKRGLLKPSDSKLTTWLKNAFDQEKIEVIPNVTIILLGDNRKPLMKWTINNVWPRSWKIGELNAEKGEVLIETLELNYNRLIFENP
jgi:phage tail-like protein